MNHVWMLRLHSLAAKQRLLDAKELTIKGGCCLVIDPANTAVKLKLHWVPYDVPNGQVKKELERYGKVSEITRDFFRERGFEAVESNTRSVRMTLKEGYTVDSLPHEMRLEGCKVLVVMPGRAPLCLRCRRTGHIRRDCRIPRCSDCHRYGHEAEDCVKTYASVARDRKVEDNSDYLMDGIEAEEAVGGSPPSDVLPIEQSGAPTFKDDDNQDAASQARDSERTTRGQDARQDRAKHRLPEEQTLSAGGQPATVNSNPGGKNGDAGAADEQGSKMDASQTVKRPREPGATPDGTGQEANLAWPTLEPLGPKKAFEALMSAWQISVVLMGRQMTPMTVPLSPMVLCEKEEESAQEVIVELRQLADKYNFGDRLDRMLRDKIVCGIRNIDVQKALLSRPKLTLQETENIVLAAASARQSVKLMKPSDVKSGSELHKMTYWQCSRKLECKARAHTIDEEVVKLINEHSHAPSRLDQEAKLAYSSMKERARTTEEPNQAIVGRLVAEMTPEACSYLPPQDTVKRTLRGAAVSDEMLQEKATEFGTTMALLWRWRIRWMNFRLRPFVKLFDNSVGEKNPDEEASAFLDIDEETNSWEPMSDEQIMELVGESAQQGHQLVENFAPTETADEEERPTVTRCEARRGLETAIAYLDQEGERALLVAEVLRFLDTKVGSKAPVQTHISSFFGEINNPFF
ncbi:hypothetical protein ISCGN_006878 [Ixodes scapularis]